MRTDITELIHTEAPPRPACFDKHTQWTQWLASAHEAGLKVVRRVDVGKHAGQRVTRFEVLPVGQQSHCVECSQQRRDAMRAAGRCFPVKPPHAKPEPEEKATHGRHSFELAGIATIKRAKPDRRGPEDNRYLVLVLDVVFPRVEASVCAYFDDMLTAFIYRQTIAGRVVRNEALKPISYALQIAEATVEIDRQTFHQSDVGNFVITPIDGTSVSLACRISIYPGKANCSDLIGRIKDGVRLRIVGPADLFDEDEAKPQAQAALL